MGSTTPRQIVLGCVRKGAERGSSGIQPPEATNAPADGLLPTCTLASEDDLLPTCTLASANEPCGLRREHVEVGGNGGSEIGKMEEEEEMWVDLIKAHCMYEISYR